MTDDTELSAYQQQVIDLLTAGLTVGIVTAIFLLVVAGTLWGKALRG